MSPRARLVLGLGIATGLFALCIISGYLSLPPSGFGVLKSLLAGTLAPASTRRLLSSKEVRSRSHSIPASTMSSQEPTTSSARTGNTLQACVVLAQQGTVVMVPA